MMALISACFSWCKAVGSWFEGDSAPSAAADGSGVGGCGGDVGEDIAVEVNLARSDDEVGSSD